MSTRNKTSTIQDTAMVPLATHEAVIAERDAMVAKHEAMAAKYAKAQGIIAKLTERVDSLEEGLQKRCITGVPRHSKQNGYADALETALDVEVAAQNGRGVRGDGHHMVWFRMNLIDEYIQDDKLLHECTLLKPQVFEYIVYLVEQYIETHGGKLYYNLISRSSDPGNRSKLKIRHMVFVTFFRKRSNMVPSLVGALFGMSRSTVKRQCDFIDAALEQVLPGATAMKNRLKAIQNSDDFIKFTGGTLMVDGTVTPAPRSNDTDNPETSGYSGKHHMPGFNTLVTGTGHGLLVDISETVPGNRHDFRVLKENPLDLGLWHMNGAPKSAESAKAMADMTVLADRGFIGMDKHFEHINSRVPHKGKDVKSSKEIRAAYRSKNHAAIAAALGLTIQQYIENKRISSERSLIERVIGMLKRWDILSGIFRGSASELNRQFEILSGVVNMDILWPEIVRAEAPLLKSLMAERAAYKKPR